MSNSTISQLGTFSFDKSVMIGSGKFGKVYLGNDTNTNQPICVKVFSKIIFFGENILETICQKEIDLTKLIMKINHENLVRIIDVVDTKEQVEAYLIMELCDKTLTQQIQEKQMNKQEIIDFIYQVATGYYCLEQQNIVHRDLKPDNILIKVEKGKVIYKVNFYNIQLADFGLGKLLEQATKETQTKYVGTAYYFAPEMVDNAFKAYQSKCDIFSFGIIIFELLVGNKTFESQLNREKLKSQSFESVFSSQLRGVDEWFKSLLSSMIIYDWTKRIGWKDLKVILDLNMNDKYKGILGKMEEDNLFFGYYPQNQITVKVFDKQVDKDIIRDFQFIDNFSYIDTINAIQVYDLINKENSPLIYVIMEKVDCSLQKLMETSKFTSVELVNFIEQMTNGLTVIQRLKKKVFSLSLQNILVTKLDQKERIFKIIDYEFYETKDKSKNQSHILPEATVQQFAWIVYQLILQKNIPYSEFLVDINQQVKKNALLLGLDQNIKSLVSSIMIPDQSLKVIYDQVQVLKNEQKEKSKSSEGIGMGFGTINNQQKFMSQNTFPIQQNKGQFPQLQNQQINIPNKIQFNQNVPAPPQQQPQQTIFQPQQIQSNVPQNKILNQPPQPGFIPPNNMPVFPPQNQQQLNQNNFVNLNFQNNNPIKFGTNKVQPQQFIPNQQPQQQFKPAQNFNLNPNRATNLNQNNTQQFHPQPQPQNQVFQNFNNTFLQPQKK